MGKIRGGDIMQYELFSSNWAVNSGFEELREKLNDLVPLHGRCEFSQSKNKHLDRFRRAQNLLYDLFNNGLGNRRQEFRKFFGYAPVSSRGGTSRSRWEQIEIEFEPIFTNIMQEAAREQGIKI